MIRTDGKPTIAWAPASMLEPTTHEGRRDGERNEDADAAQTARYQNAEHADDHAALLGSAPQ